MTVRVRAFDVADAAFLACLYHESVHSIGARHYSAAQVRAWSPAVGDPTRWSARAGDGRTTLVAVDAAGTPVAYGDLERDGHIDHLYCRSDHAGTGVAALLYAALEEAARSHGLPRLYVEASEPARRFFLRRGFVLNHRRDFTIGDVPIHNFAMSKRLRDDVPAG